MNNQQLSRIFDGQFHTEPLEEIVFISLQICPDIDPQFIRNIHTELTGYFHGLHPRFQKSTLPYHNLRHTIMVVLATARLFHGLHCSHVTISSDTLLKGLLAAYFHDTGMLLQKGDATDCGTSYMANHEIRSIHFLSHYCKTKNISDVVARDCSLIINYTELNRDPATFTMHSHQVQIAGQVVGSADILAQMADRYYLECLPLLFGELKAGGINSHNSALELMEHTANFYRNVVLKRLLITFSNTSRVMQTHFRERYMLDRNLYKENIDRNIAYLKAIITKCDDIDCLSKYLKRTPPVL